MTQTPYQHGAPPALSPCSPGSSSPHAQMVFFHVHPGDAANIQILPRDLSSILDATKKETIAWPRRCMVMPEGVAQFSLDQWLRDGLCCGAWCGGIRGFLLVSRSVSVGFRTTPPCASHRTEKATCLQKHLSLNSSLFLFVITK